MGKKIQMTIDDVENRVYAINTPMVNQKGETIIFTAKPTSTGAQHDFVIFTDRHKTMTIEIDLGDSKIPPSIFE
jgi:hypothetical protein